jgi:hypothetical protein
MRFAGGGAGSMLNTRFTQRPNVSFSGLQFSGTGGEGIGQAAAAAAPVGQIFNSLTSPAYDQIAGNAIKNAAAEDAAKMKAEAAVQSAGLTALGQVHGTMLQADAYEEAAQIQADAYKEAERIQKSAAKSAENKSKTGSFIKTLGTVASFALPLVASDERTKHTIKKLDDVTLMLRELNPVSFYYKDEYTSDPDRMHYGFVAQEYKDVMPDAVHIDKDSGMYRIDINQLIALLVRGYQQLDNRITRMEVKNVLAGVR